MSWSEAAALLGALVAAAAFVRKVWQERTSVKAELTQGAVGPQGGRPIDVIILIAENHGGQTVTLSGYSLLMPNGRQLTFRGLRFSAQFPHALEPGMSCSVYVRPQDVAEGLSSAGYPGSLKLRAVFWDQLGKRFTSRRVRFDSHGWK